MLLKKHEVLERLNITKKELDVFTSQGRLPSGYFSGGDWLWNVSDVDALAEHLADEDADQQVDDALKAGEDARVREQELVDSLQPPERLTVVDDSEFKYITKTELPETKWRSLVPRINPADVLRAGAQHMEDRAATYDKPAGERSMGATVDAFNAITGNQVTEEQGWMFMALLKMVRSQQGQFKLDNYEDGAAYFALAAESGAKSRTSGE